MASVTLKRGDAAYEQARRDAVWNGRTPDRYPDVIVQVESVEDVVVAVREAAAQGLRIAVRSGGHSWAGNQLRDGGMLIDLSRLNGLEVDTEAMTAVVGPGAKGIAASLEPHGVFFPGGHDRDVGAGGYLLQGGFGWNGRILGPACASVIGIDVVTADGELLHANEHQHADLLWAARGAGPGFFGIVVAFHLRVYEAPKHIALSVARFPIDVLDEVFTWAERIGPSVAREVELNVTVARDEDGTPDITVIAPAIVDSPEQAAEVLAFLDECPVRDRAIEVVSNVPATLTELYAAVGEFYPAGSRYAVDNMWTHAPAEELLPGIHEIVETLPPRPSALLWLNWGGDTQERPPMAFSVEDRTYMAVYGVWSDPADDERYSGWAGGRMRALAPQASGIQLADENLGNRPARFISDENMARLDELRDRYDPEHRFHPWMGRLPSGAAAA